jgi:hypothetical protein
MKATVLSGQSLLDLAMQTAGDATAAIAMAIANGISPTFSPHTGATLATVPTVNRDAAAYLSANDIKPATRPP